VAPGCGTLFPPTAPQTPQQALNEARLLVTAIQQEANTQFKAGILSKDAHKVYTDKLNDANKKLNQAQVLVDAGKGDFNSIDVIRLTLLALQKEVAKRAAEERAKKGAK
jgi:hypothetical protein